MHRRGSGGDIRVSRTAQSVLGKSSAATAITVRCFRGGWWISITGLSASRGPRSRGSGALGARCVGMLASRSASVLGKSAGCRTSSSRKDTEGVRPDPAVTSGRGTRGAFVPAGFRAGIDTHGWSNSEREVKGHERAAAVVHPIKASPWTQDREDRKRSRREYPTNTGARFAGRALCSPSQRDERKHRWRRRWWRS